MTIDITVTGAKITLDDEGSGSPVLLSEGGLRLIPIETVARPLADLLSANLVLPRRSLHAAGLCG